jgi:FtsP/CotA-like multicopper oxidase with cupredoxin domain
MPITRMPITRMPMSRRRFVAAGLATAAATGTVAPAFGQAAAQKLTATTRSLDVNGKAARVYGLIGPGGKPGVTLGPGERFRIDLVNATEVPTIVHWHGQTPPWKDDGFPWPQTPSLTAGTSRGYDFVPLAGTHWMHSHHGLQEQRLMTAPMIVRSAADYREDRQQVVVMLHDFSFRAPDEILAELTHTTPAEAERMATRDENVPAPTTPQPITAGAVTASPPAMNMGAGAKRDLNDVDYDAFLANDRTIADPEVVRVTGGGRVRLRIINGSASTQFWINLGSLTGEVIAADGHPVSPVAGNRFPLSIAQRLDILLDISRYGAFPILAEVEGKRARAAIVLATAGARIAKIAEGASAAPPVDNSLEAKLSAIDPLPVRPPDLVHQIRLTGDMQRYAWALDGQYWPEIVPLMLKRGQRVEIELVNETAIAHPMHLHGHTFQVTALDRKPIAGAVRDTVMVPPFGTVRLAFDADNPGRWAFGCHTLYHLATGMITEFRYEGVAV